MAALVQDVLVRRLLLLGDDVDPYRVPEILFDEIIDPSRHCRREAADLSLLAAFRLREDFLDVLLETHRQHLVCFIQDHMRARR